MNFRSLHGGHRLCQHIFGFGPLESHKRQILTPGERDSIRQMARKMREIVILPRCIDDDVERPVGFGAGDHQIIECSALLRQELRIALLMLTRPRMSAGTMRSSAVAVVSVSGPEM